MSSTLSVTLSQAVLCLAPAEGIGGSLPSLLAAIGVTAGSREGRCRGEKRTK